MPKSENRWSDPNPGKRGQTKLRHVILAEVFEPRIVLSVQPLLDIAHHALLDHLPWNHSSGEWCDAFDFEPPSSSQIDPNFAVQPQLTEAHAGTGWNAVQKQFGLSGNGQTVAVIDSGIAWDHQALGKGFGAGYRVVGGWDFAENDALPYDDAPAGFHGTHVAGIIGSDNVNQPGVATEADLVALRVFNDSGKGQLDWTEKALQWVHENRFTFANPITTVNLSLGTTWNSESVPAWATLEDELLQLFQDGITVVASAGNSFQQYQAPGLSYPAASPYVIPVSSVDANGELSNFSQRADRVIAAPGRNIWSTVPDHVLGRDGKIDDWSLASGTSMAAPYLAGASVLVREAMELTGATSIHMQSIYQVLQDTADTVWDSVTSQSYDRLNLSKAIDSILPDDMVGDTLATAASLSLLDGSKSEGWINRLGDRDVYRFTAEHDGTLKWSFDSQALDAVQWNIWSQGIESSLGVADHATLHVKAGQSYAFGIQHLDAIGPYSIGWDFAAAGGNTSNVGSASSAKPIELGIVDYTQRMVTEGQVFSMKASHTGTFTIQLDALAEVAGNMQARIDSGTWQTDARWEAQQLRLDLDVREGQTIELKLPTGQGLQAELDIVNLVTRTGSSLVVSGTDHSDAFQVDLQNGVFLAVGDVQYRYGNEIASIAIHDAAGNDQLEIVGSLAADKIELRPGHAVLEASIVQVTATGFENIGFSGGGGADRAILYDAETDDTLHARPESLEMIGVGYRFDVSDVDRMFVHATAGGQDIAYLFDSQGDDTLSIRPQFCSLRGGNYFNYISGFERVFAYASGGIDTAQLYDSQGDDRFNTSGDSASIVGHHFFSFTRQFEQVEAYATAGGHDTAALYANRRDSISSGSDFFSFADGHQTRSARGFEQRLAYVEGAEIKLSSLSAFSDQIVVDAMIQAPNSIISPLAPSGVDMEHSDESFLVAEPIPSQQNRVTASRTHNPTQELDLLSDALDHLQSNVRSADLAWIADGDLEKRIRARLFADY